MAFALGGGANQVVNASTRVFRATMIGCGIERGRAIGPRLAEPNRVEWLNEVYERFAAEHAGVTVIRFGQYLCDVRPSPLRDGIHLSIPGAVGAWGWLTPRILDTIARSKASLWKVAPPP